MNMKGSLNSRVVTYLPIIFLGIISLSIQQITNPPDCASPPGYDIRNLTKYEKHSSIFKLLFNLNYSFSGLNFGLLIETGNVLTIYM
jgi:hypothetical protein